MAKQNGKSGNIGNVLLPLAVKSESIESLQNLSVTGVNYDSRQVKPGNAFVCIAGDHFDGHQFVSEAIKNGATCIIGERPLSNLSVPNFLVTDARLALALLADYHFDHPSQKLRLLAVTGTNGKTTTTHLIEHILNFAGHKAGLIGTLGARWPGQTTYQNTKHTTPQSSDLHQLLAAMVDAGCSHVAAEVSSHALVQKRVAGCHFASACLTNVTQDHLDFHQTMTNYTKAKRLLFEGLNDSLQIDKSAIINIDDPTCKQFSQVVREPIKKWSYGWGKEADIHVRAVEFTFNGTNLDLSTPVGNVQLKLKLTGQFNVYNVMAALAVCLAEKIELSICQSAIDQFTGVSGRFETVSTGGTREPLVIVDYAHTPDGLDNVLKTARGLLPHSGRLIVVFGCGGDRDASKRPQMGQIAESLSDTVIITSDNPRTENPEQIIADILAGIKRMKSVYVEPDRSLAIRQAINRASNSDVIVVAGKGHENYQILADRTIPFDDRTEVKLALQERGDQCLSMS